MQRPQPKPVTLDEVVITKELSLRSPRPSNLLDENQAMRTLSRQMANAPETMLQSLVEKARELCEATSAGISLLESNGEEVFRQKLKAGTLAPSIGDISPRNSPFGICLDRGTPQLYKFPERYFTYLQDANIPLVECLVLPLIADNQAIGTIWIASHDERRLFDGEDVRVMSSLADFAVAALLLEERPTQKRLAADARLEAEIAERKRADEIAREKEAYFRAIADLVPDLLWRNDVTGNTDWYNQRWLDYTGQTLEEAQGYGWLEAIHPDDRAQSLANFQNAIDERRLLRQEHRIKGTDGNYRWFLVRVHPVFDGDGQIIQWFGAASDIHAQRLALHALRESEKRLRATIENLPGGAAFIVDRDLRYLLAEGEALSIAGFKPEDLVNKTIFEALPPELTAKYEALYRKALAGESFEFEHNAHDRTYISRGTPLRSPSGEVYAVLAISYDITDRKRTEEQLRQAAEIDAFRVTLSDALRSLADPAEIQIEAMRVLGEHLGVTRAQYYEAEPNDDYVVSAGGYTDGAPPVIERIRMDDFGSFVKEAFRAGRTLAVADVSVDARVSKAELASYDALGFRAYIGVPLVKAGRFVASLGIHHAKLHDWTDEEIALAEETAERTWAAVERARAEAELRRSEIQRIREQAAREEERQRAESLAELDRAKTLFFNNVSHEFRTPLTLLLAPLQDALSDRAHPLAPAQRERLDLVHRNSLRLLKLVNNLLDFSRIEAGRMEAIYEPTDLATFTTELASVFRSASERAGLRLIVDCPPLLEPVYVDRSMWEKIVFNLLSNAFKYTFEGEIAVKLHQSDRVVVQIQDTGTGIAAEHLPHLFERFYQVRGLQARTHEGSGIGLALVHELIQLHGGTIEVSSAVGQGTSFAIALPFGRAHLPDDRIQATNTLAAKAVGAAPYVEEAERWLPEADSRLPSLESSKFPSGTLREGLRPTTVSTRREPPRLELPHKVQSSKKAGGRGLQGGEASSPHSPSRRQEAGVQKFPLVLLVDDNADMRDYLTRILSDRFQVEAVADGEAAIAAARKRVPALVLSDVMMPRLDGFGLLKALRADSRTREIPIVLLSARAGVESVVEGLEAGADDYLIKPFSAQELVTRINTHLQMSQQRSQALQQEKTASRKKDELLANVSHELNTPLVAILGWTRLLRANPPSQSILMKSLETIERNATLQAKLIQDLLDISRITAGKLRLSVEPIELKSVMEEAIASIAQMAQAKKIDLVQRAQLGRFLVMGDRGRLQQVIYNLLTNAIKFTPELGKIEVELLATQEENSLDAFAQIAIADTGIGIAADFLPQIFNRFYQVESNSAKGLGLGLAIARHLVELHDGSISAESAGVGQGTIFMVKLPLSKDL
jgi:PAS domain S-box-containing protein